MKQSFKKHYDKNSAVFNHTCLHNCRIIDVKTKKNTSNKSNKLKDNTPNRPVAEPMRLLVRSYLSYSFILLYIRRQRNKRALRRLAMADMNDALGYAQP